MGPLLRQMISWLDFYNKQLKPREMRPPLVNGNDLMNHLHLSPGPLLGQLLKKLAEMQWEGRIISREEALSQAARLLQDWQAG